MATNIWTHYIKNCIISRYLVTFSITLDKVFRKFSLKEK